MSADGVCYPFDTKTSKVQAILDLLINHLNKSDNVYRCLLYFVFVIWNTKEVFEKKMC